MYTRIKSHHSRIKTSPVKGKTGRTALFLFIFLAALSCGKKSAETGSTGPKTVSGKEIVHIPLAEVADGKARFYQYAHEGKTIRFFVLKSADGIYRAAFDACDVCWRAGKGYYQQGDSMVCRNCGRRFASTMVNEVEGGCNPAPLKRDVKGDKLEIRTADIAAGSRYFNL